MSKTFFAYHLTHVFGPFALDSYYTNSEKPREGDLVYVISGDSDEEITGKDYWLEGVFKVHRRHEGTWHLKGKTGNSREFKLRLTLTPKRIPDGSIPLTVAAWYDRREVHRFFSSGQNFNPLPTSPNYKERFDNLLSGFGQGRILDLVEDLRELGETVADQTEREALIKARVGQGKFRADVTQMWALGEVCPLTRIDIPEMLTASHIKPWRDADNTERLDPANGLLLATHVDKLFDRYLLSFRPNFLRFEVEVHPRVRSVAEALGISKGMSLKSEHLGFESTRRLQSYLTGHYERFCESINSDKPKF